MFLHDDRAFGDQLAVVEQERRDVTLGVDGQEVVAVFGLLGGEVDLDPLEGEPGFAQGDVGATGNKRRA